MEGDLARLPEIVALAREHDAIVIVDDSHGVGVLGEHGLGTPEHFGLRGEIDVVTGTLGKALGGAAGGYVAASADICELLAQRSRPQLFSNALPATVACSALAAVNALRDDPSLVARLRANTPRFRAMLVDAGFAPIPGDSAIIPIVLGETAVAIRFSERLLEHGVFVTGFGFPVVPEGTARVRVQMSAALEPEHLDRALAAFVAVGREFGLILARARASAFAASRSTEPSPTCRSRATPRRRTVRRGRSGGSERRGGSAPAHRAAPGSRGCRRRTGRGAVGCSSTSSAVSSRASRSAAASSEIVARLDMAAGLQQRPSFTCSTDRC